MNKIFKFVLKSKSIRLPLRFIKAITFIKYKNHRRNLYLHKNGKRVLIEFDKACEKAGVTYWLEFGTLLGAVRDKNFISHDLDIDTGMYLDEYDPCSQKVFE